MHKVWSRALGTLVGLVGSVAVFVAPTLAVDGDALADAVLGQPELNSSLCGDGRTPTAASLCRPVDIAVDPQSGRLFAYDNDDHRILSWANRSRLQTDEPADLVLGQPNFTTARPCSTEEPIAGSASAACFLGGGLTVDNEGSLWKVDSERGRVLRFGAPLRNGQSADLVLGTAAPFPDCRNVSPEAIAFCSPDDVAVDRSGRVYVSDVFLNRVVRFTPPFSSAQHPDLVLDIPCALCRPDRLAIGPNGELYVLTIPVAAPQPSFVLRYSHPDQDATRPDLTLSLPPHPAGFDPSGSFAILSSLAVDRGGALYVGRLGQVFRFPSPVGRDRLPELLLGATDLTVALPAICDQRLDDANVCLVTGLAVDHRGDVWISENNANRLVRFNQPIRGTQP